MFKRFSTSIRYHSYGIARVSPNARIGQDIAFAETQVGGCDLRAILADAAGGMWDPVLTAGTLSQVTRTYLSRCPEVESPTDADIAYQQNMLARSAHNALTKLPPANEKPSAAAWLDIAVKQDRVIVAMAGDTVLGRFTQQGYQRLTEPHVDSAGRPNRCIGVRGHCLNIEKQRIQVDRPMTLLLHSDGLTPLLDQLPPQLMYKLSQLSGAKAARMLQSIMDNELAQGQDSCIRDDATAIVIRMGAPASFWQQWSGKGGWA
jgi:serine/threonine protein phosphatase PrpC